MALAAITTSGPTIMVGTAEELKDAYELFSHQDGGGTILVEPGSYGDALVLYQYGQVDGDQPVVIASANPDDPAHFTEINLRTCVNVRIENIHVDSTGVDRDDWIKDLTVQDADNIQIVGSTFIHDSGSALKALGEPVETMGGFEDSTNILFEGNYIDGYFSGVHFLDVTNFEVLDNEITNLQADGIRGGGWQDALVQGNYIHDFYPIEQTYTHTDMIQIWGVNVDQITKNVTIADNILVAGNTTATQSIFIRSGELGIDSSETSGYFQDITISNNLIYNSHIHGITVDDTQGLVIDGNTLLWNPDATMTFGSDPINYQPKIWTRGSLEVTVTNNIARDIDGENLTLDEDDNNQIISFNSSADLSYVTNHFVNPLVGDGVTLEDLYVLPTSPLYGIAGSTFGNAPDDVSAGVTAVITTTAAADNSYELTFDASASVGVDGSLGTDYTYHWSFADGSTAEGESVTKLYSSGGFKGVDLQIRLDGDVVADIMRNVTVQTKDIFAFDFEDGVADISDNAPEVIDNGTTTASHDGTGFLIGDDNKLELGRGTEDMYEMEKFGLALDLTPTGDEQSGIFLHLHGTMTGIVSEEGHIVFQLTTDEGTFDLISREPIFEDGGTHRIGIAFDGTTGQLEIFADGESVSSTEAWGTTPEPVYWNLVFGNTWQDSMDAIIDNIEMSRDPAIAGNLPDVTPPVIEPPVGEPPPVEDPPAEDPPAEAPPAEDPPAEDPGDRGGEREPVASDEDSDFFLSKLLDIILSIFGLGSDDPAPVPAAETNQSSAVMLTDVLPITAPLDEDLPEEDEDDEADIELAA